MQSHAQLARDAMMPWHRRSAMGVVVAILAAACLSAAALAQPCTPAWTNAGAELVATLAPIPVVRAIIEFDPDGPGPLQRDLFIAGAFSFASDPSVSGLARWDGFGLRSAGTSLGAGVAGASYIECMCVGPDIAGAGDRQALYIGGVFQSVSGIPAKLIAKWDGENWTSIGSLAGNQVGQITFHDFDGAGPQPPRLVVGGGLQLARMLYWDGSAWLPVAGYPGSTPKSLISFDPDGGGPALPQLHVKDDGVVAGSNFTWMYDGANWSTFPTPSVHAKLDKVDPDGSGPEVLQLFLTSRASQLGGIWKHEGVHGWQFFGMSTDTPVQIFCSVDLDGAGPMPARLLAGSAHLNAPNGLFELADGAWRLAFATHGWLYASGTFDEDGAGPREPAFFLAGQLDTVDGVPVNSIARYGCPFNMPRCYGDADGSGLVEFNDVSLILARWGSRDQPGDIDRDGVVGMNDIVAVLASWGSPCEATRPAGVDPAAAWRDRGIEDFNDDGHVNFDDYTWAIANAGLDPRSPFGRANHTSEVQP